MLPPWSKLLHLLPNLFSSTVCSYNLILLKLFPLFQWFSIIFRRKSKNPYYDFGNCSDFISYHLPSPSFVPATVASWVFSEHTEHGPAFPFGLLTARNLSLPRYSHGFLITFSSLLKCQLIIGTFLTILSVIGTLFPMSCPPSVPILYLSLFFFYSVHHCLTFYIIFLSLWR